MNIVNALRLNREFSAKTIITALFPNAVSVAFNALGGRHNSPVAPWYGA
jgi:hypothetical protein